MCCVHHLRGLWLSSAQRMSAVVEVTRLAQSVQTVACSWVQRYACHDSYLRDLSGGRLLASSPAIPPSVGGGEVAVAMKGWERRALAEGRPAGSF